MDLRVEKTKKSIEEAFLEYRSVRPLEKIKVKELCERAKINKSTFYTHYADIYDLSDQLETEAVQSVLDQIRHIDDVLDHIADFVYELFRAYSRQECRLNILFSGSRSGLLMDKIAEGLKKMIYEQYPECRQDAEFNTVLSYRIYGGYYAFRENRIHGEDKVIEIIGQMTERLGND